MFWLNSPDVFNDLSRNEKRFEFLENACHTSKNYICLKLAQEPSKQGIENLTYWNPTSKSNMKMSFFMRFQLYHTVVFEILHTPTLSTTLILMTLSAFQCAYPPIPPKKSKATTTHTKKRFHTVFSMFYIKAHLSRPVRWNKFLIYWPNNGCAPRGAMLNPKLRPFQTQASKNPQGFFRIRNVKSPKGSQGKVLNRKAIKTSLRISSWIKAVFAGWPLCAARERIN